MKCEIWRLMAIYSLIMYFVDTGSDIFVSIDLFLRCHYFFASSVLSFVFLPGLIYGLYNKYVTDIGEAYGNTTAVLSVFWFIPYTVLKLFKAVLADKSPLESTEHDRAKL